MLYYEVLELHHYFFNKTHQSEANYKHQDVGWEVG